MQDVWVVRQSDTSRNGLLGDSIHDLLEDDFWPASLKVCSGASGVVRAFPRFLNALHSSVVLNG